MGGSFVGWMSVYAPLERGSVADARHSLDIE